MALKRPKKSHIIHTIPIVSIMSKIGIIGKISIMGIMQKIGRILTICIVGNVGMIGKVLTVGKKYAIIKSDTKEVGR